LNPIKEPDHDRPHAKDGNAQRVELLNNCL